MACEFHCCECQRHIIHITADKPPEPPLCAQCLHLPGWHEDPKLLAILDPHHVTAQTEIR